MIYSKGKFVTDGNQDRVHFLVSGKRALQTRPRERVLPDHLPGVRKPAEPRSSGTRLDGNLVRPGLSHSESPLLRVSELRRPDLPPKAMRRIQTASPAFRKPRLRRSA